MRQIDADALIRRWCGIKCGCERGECGREIEPCVVVMSIEEAPTIEPEPEWIPVGERLPEKDGHYLVNVKNGWFPKNVIAIDLLRFEDGKWKYYFGFENDDFEDFEDPVIAWMPLPEPYKEENK